MTSRRVVNSLFFCWIPLCFTRNMEPPAFATFAAFRHWLTEEERQRRPSKYWINQWVTTPATVASCRTRLFTEMERYGQHVEWTESMRSLFAPLHTTTDHTTETAFFQEWIQSFHEEHLCQTMFIRGFNQFPLHVQTIVMNYISQSRLDAMFHLECRLGAPHAQYPTLPNRSMVWTNQIIQVTLLPTVTEEEVMGFTHWMTSLNLVYLFLSGIDPIPEWVAPYMVKWFETAEEVEWTQPWVSRFLWFSSLSPSLSPSPIPIPTKVKFLSVHSDTIRQFKQHRHDFYSLDTLSFSRTDAMSWFQLDPTSICIPTWNRLHTVSLDQIKCDTQMVSNIFMWIHVPTIHLSIMTPPQEWMTWLQTHIQSLFTWTRGEYTGCYRWEHVHLSFVCFFEPLTTLMSVENQCFEWITSLLHVTRLDIMWKRLTLPTYRQWQRTKSVGSAFAQTYIIQYRRQLQQGLLGHHDSFFQSIPSCQQKKQMAYVHHRTPLFHKLSRDYRSRPSWLDLLPHSLLEYIVCHF